MGRLAALFVGLAAPLAALALAGPAAAEKQILVSLGQRTLHVVDVDPLKFPANVLSAESILAAVQGTPAHLASFPVAIGAPESPTPPGMYSVLQMIKDPTYYSHSKKVVLQAAFGVGVVRFILIAFLPITSVLIFAQILHAGTFAAHHSAATKLLQRWFTGPLQARGQALMATVSYGLGGTLGGLCAGWIWELSQPRDVFVMSAFACGLAGMAIQKLRPRHYPAR